MIHHISINARDPLRVASVLAEIQNGKVYKFLVPDSYLTMPFDNYGTHIVVFKQGDVWVPGVDREAAKVNQTAPPDFMSVHFAISVPLDPQQIEQIGKREGWRVLIRNRGENVPFSAVEFWVENRILFEFFSPEFTPEYLEVMQPEAIDKILGQPLEPITV
ncbi:MAG: hypothetical protein HC778_03395 [Chamaesiphon sp. CSU_1_12]|nr:hypothetical protein [Chamaesiphon sp. CSU_1_12]